MTTLRSDSLMKRYDEYMSSYLFVDCCFVVFIATSSFTGVNYSYITNLISIYVCIVSLSDDNNIPTNYHWYIIQYWGTNYQYVGIQYQNGILGDNHPPNHKLCDFKTKISS